MVEAGVAAAGVAGEYMDWDSVRDDQDLVEAAAEVADNKDSVAAAEVLVDRGLAPGADRDRDQGPDVVLVSDRDEAADCRETVGAPWAHPVCHCLVPATYRDCLFWNRRMPEVYIYCSNWQLDRSKPSASQRH
jgi:hypothetical protein